MKKQTPLLNRLQMAAGRFIDNYYWYIIIVIIIIGWKAASDIDKIIYLP
jgi:hypothetical protein